jgi:hypothetical protein
MILCKRLLILSVFVSMLTGGIVFGQVSDSDFLSITPSLVTVSGNTDSAFTVSVHVNSKTPISYFTIPLTIAGHPNLIFDTTIVTGANKAISYGPLGNFSDFSQKTSLVKNNDTVITIDNDTVPPPSILIGFGSFGAPLPPSDDILVHIHLKLTATTQAANVMVDTCPFAPSNHLTIVDEFGGEYTPQWTGGTVSITGNAVDGDEAAKPMTYGLDQNFPNPFNAGTKISFSLAAPGKVDLKVYNLLGQNVKTLVNSELPAGPHNIIWDGTNNDGEIVGSGTYFYRLKAGDAYEETRQMTLLK